MTFDHIDLGNLLTMMTIVGAVVAAVYRLLGKLEGVATDVKGISRRISDVEAELKKQTDILVELAQTKERINSLEKRNEELSRRLDELSQRIAH